MGVYMRERITQNYELSREIHTNIFRFLQNSFILFR